MIKNKQPTHLSIYNTINKKNNNNITQERRYIQ